MMSFLMILIWAIPLITSPFFLSHFSSLTDLFLLMSMLIFLKPLTFSNTMLTSILALEIGMLFSVFVISLHKSFLAPFFLLTLFTLAVGEAATGLGVLIKNMRNSGVPL